MTTSKNTDTENVTRTGQDRPFHSVKQLAERWQTSEKSIRRFIEQGDLIAHRFGRQLRISDADRLAFERLNRSG